MHFVFQAVLLLGLSKRSLKKAVVTRCGGWDGMGWGGGWGTSRDGLVIHGPDCPGGSG